MIYPVSITYYDGTRVVIPFEDPESAAWEANEARANDLVKRVIVRNPVPLRFVDAPRRALVAA